VPELALAEPSEDKLPLAALDPLEEDSLFSG
jgi:hypothetical protein